MDSRLVKHFEEELEKLNAELRPFDEAVERAEEAERVMGDMEIALKKAQDDRDAVKMALGIAEGKVADAEADLKKAMADFDACKEEVCGLADEAKLAKRDEFMDILAGIEEDVREDAPIDEPAMDEPAMEEPVVEEAPIVEEPIVEEVKVEEPIVEEKPAEDHKAVFDSLMKKRKITIK